MRLCTTVLMVLCALLVISQNGNAQWAETYFSDCGGIQSLTIDGNTVFAGANGLYMSTDAGNLWVANSSWSSSWGVVSAIVRNSGDLFAASSVDVFRSTDNGSTWTGTGLPWYGGYSAVASEGSTIFAGSSSHGVFRSTDRGENWTRTVNGLTDTAVHAVLALPGNLYAGTSSGVFRSTDGGDNWTITSLASRQVLCMAYYPARGGITVGTDSRLWMSTDNGSTWDVWNLGLTDYVVRSLAVSGVWLYVGTSENG